MNRTSTETAKESQEQRKGEPMTGLSSRPLYSPSRSIAQDGAEHLYVFHDGLWYHFPPKGWKPKA